METVAERIIKLVNELEGGNKSKFARKSKVTPAYISKIGKNPNIAVTDRVIDDICEAYKVSKNWLLTGEGEPRPTNTQKEKLAAMFGQILSSEPDSTVLQIAEAFMTLTPEEWEAWGKMLKKMAEIYNAKNDSP